MAGVGETELRIFFIQQDDMTLDEFVAHQDAGKWLYVPLKKKDVEKWQGGLTVKQMTRFLFEHMDGAPKKEVQAASDALELMATFPFPVDLQLFQGEDDSFAVVLPGISTGEEMTDLHMTDLSSGKEMPTEINIRDGEDK